MKILFVYCNELLEEELPVSICQMSAHLKQAGFDVDVFETTYYKTKKGEDSLEFKIRTCQLPDTFRTKDPYKKTSVFRDFVRTIDRYKPDIIGFSVSEATEHLFRSLLAKVGISKKNRPLIGIGGISAILGPERFTTLKGLDFICLGEGEIPFVELCKAYRAGQPWYTTRGFFCRHKGAWLNNGIAPLVSLDALLPPDFSVFENPRDPKKPRTFYLEVSRGCPYGCTFCCDSALKNHFAKHKAGSWFRYKSVKTIEAELKHLLALHGEPEYIIIKSPTFLSAPTRWLREFAEFYKNYRYCFWFFVRAENVNEERVAILKSMKSDIRMTLGLEHGNDAFRKNVLKRGYSNAQFVKACRLLKRAGFFVTANIIIGFPGDSREMALEGVSVLKKAGIGHAVVFIFTPFYGTELRRLCVDKGMIRKDEVTKCYTAFNYLLRNNTMTAEEVFGLVRTFQFYLAFGKKYWPTIKAAEGTTRVSQKLFRQLREVFYNRKGWA